MLNIFFKDLRQNLYLIIVCFLLPFTVQPISKIFFKSEWVDAKAILYIILFFFFIPVYMAMISSYIFRNENLNIFKFLPVSYSKIIFSKFLFILFNYFLLSIYYFSFIDFLRFQTEKIEMFMIYFLHLIIVLFLCFLSFSFSNFLKKDLALFLSFFLTCFNVFIFAFVLSKTKGYILLAFEIYFLFLFIFLFSIFLSYLSSKYKLLSKDFYPLIKILFIFFFIIPSFYLLAQMDKWKRSKIFVNSLKFILNEDEILLQYSLKENYLYNFNTKKLDLLVDLVGLSVTQVNGNKIYLHSMKKSGNFCETPLLSHLFYIYDMKNKKMQILGNYPSNSFFYKNFVIFYDWLKKENNIYLIGFKNEEKKTCFTDYAKQFVFLKDFLFYQKYENGTFKYYFVNYENLEKKEILNEEWKFYFSWKRDVFPHNHWYLLKDDIYKIEFPSCHLKNMKNFFPLISFSNELNIIYNILSDKHYLYLLKGDEVIKKIEKPKMDLIYSGLAFEKYSLVFGKDKNVVRKIIIELEDENIKFYFLPEEVIGSYFLRKHGELIIIKEKKIPFFEDLFYYKAYLYNFKTGKERPL